MMSSDDNYAGSDELVDSEGPLPVQFAEGTEFRVSWDMPPANVTAFEYEAHYGPGVWPTAGEAADLITEAAGRFTVQLQEHADRTAQRNRELVEAINTLTDLMDEILESVAKDGVVLGKQGCADRVADRELIARMRLANRQAKIMM